VFHGYILLLGDELREIVIDQMFGEKKGIVMDSPSLFQL
jgi:hypothetical protein